MPDRRSYLLHSFEIVRQDILSEVAQAVITRALAAERIRRAERTLEEIDRQRIATAERMAGHV